MNKFKLSTRSQGRLRGINSYLVEIVKHAIRTTNVDFGVLSGVRTLTEQRVLVERGVSKTLKSKHLTGEAVDLVPYIRGQSAFELVPAIHVAAAMWGAVDAMEPSEFQVVWGGSWLPLHRRQLSPEESYTEELMAGMLNKRIDEGKYFVDAFHFELRRAQ